LDDDLSDVDFFMIQDRGPWWQTVGGNVHSTNVSNPVPITCAWEDDCQAEATLGDSDMDAGLVSHVTSSSLGDAEMDQGFYANSGPAQIPENYQYFLNLLQNNPDVVWRDDYAPGDNNDAGNTYTGDVTSAE
jgi:hypothetical protein